jgi:phosphoserine phosphatase
MRLALFDLDNTLLAGDSDFEWAQFLIEKGVLDREVYEARNQGFSSSTRPARWTSTSSSISS